MSDFHHHEDGSGAQLKAIVAALVGEQREVAA